MTYEVVGIVLRGFERIIIVSAAFAAIWLGYRLFDSVVSDKGSFEGSIGNWKVKLQRIAPGVFFAFFGAGVLVFSLHSPVNINQNAPVSTDQNGRLELPQEQHQIPTEPQAIREQRSIVYGQQQIPASSDSRDRELFVAMSSVIQMLSRPEFVNKLDPPDRQLVDFSLPRFLTHRDLMIDRIFGEE